MAIATEDLKTTHANINQAYGYAAGTIQFSKDLTYSSVNPLALFYSLNIPLSHKAIARNYMLIKRVFGSQVLVNKLTEEDEGLLRQFGFNLLHRTTSQNMYEEIAFLQKWSASKNEELKLAADHLLKIRSKELKNIVATNFTGINKSKYSAYKVLEKYFASLL